MLLIYFSSHDIYSSNICAVEVTVTHAFLPHWWQPTRYCFWLAEPTGHHHLWQFWL